MFEENKYRTKTAYVARKAFGADLDHICPLETALVLNRVRVMLRTYFCRCVPMELTMRATISAGHSMAMALEGQHTGLHLSRVAC